MDELPYLFWVVKHRRASPCLYHFPCRAAAVDVNDIKPIRNKLRRLNHFIHIVPEKLHCNGLFLRCGAKHIGCGEIPPHDPSRAYEFSIGKPCAIPLRKRPKCHVGDSCHGAEKHFAFECWEFHARVVRQAIKKGLDANLYILHSAGYARPQCYEEIK